VNTSQIDVLIRGEDKVSLFENLGVKAITFQSLDETDFIRKVSSNYDGMLATFSKLMPRQLTLLSKLSSTLPRLPTLPLQWP